MPIIAILLIVLSACLHITWNYLNKEGIKDVISWILISIVVVIMSIPLIIIYRHYIPDLLKFWPLMLISFFFSALQTWALNTAYRYGDYTLIYPIKNALPIVFTALVTAFLSLGKPVTLLGYIGYVFIVVGCVLFPVVNFKEVKFKDYFNISLIFTVLAACGSCIYSVIDKIVLNRFIENTNISSMGASLLYTPFLYFAIAMFLVPLSIVDKYCFKIDYSKIKFNYGKIIFIALLSGGAYALVLIALTFASNAGYVVAFRQVGIPLSLIMGYCFLKEKIYPGKILGVISIITGLILITLCK